MRVVKTVDVYLDVENEKDQIEKYRKDPSFVEVGHVYFENKWCIQFEKVIQKRG